MRILASKVVLFAINGYDGHMSCFSAKNLGCIGVLSVLLIILRFFWLNLLIGAKVLVCRLLKAAYVTNLTNTLKLEILLFLKGLRLKRSLGLRRVLNSNRNQDRLKVRLEGVALNGETQSEAI